MLLLQPSLTSALGFNCPCFDLSDLLLAEEAGGELVLVREQERAEHFATEYELQFSDGQQFFLSQPFDRRFSGRCEHNTRCNVPGVTCPDGETGNTRIASALTGSDDRHQLCIDHINDYLEVVRANPPPSHAPSAFDPSYVCPGEETLVVIDTNSCRGTLPAIRLEAGVEYEFIGLENDGEGDYLYTGLLEGEVEDGDIGSAASPAGNGGAPAEFRYTPSSTGLFTPFVSGASSCFDEGVQSFEATFCFYQVTQ